MIKVRLSDQIMETKVVNSGRRFSADDVAREIFGDDFTDIDRRKCAKTFSNLARSERIVKVESGIYKIPYKNHLIHRIPLSGSFSSAC